MIFIKPAPAFLSRSAFPDADKAISRSHLGARTIRIFGLIASLFSATFAHATPSDLDTSFGTNGIITITAAATSTLFGPASATLAALQPDGKLLLVVGVTQAISGAANSSKLSWSKIQFSIARASYAAR